LYKLTVTVHGPGLAPATLNENAPLAVTGWDVGLTDPFVTEQATRHVVIGGGGAGVGSE
jgi:hypothetical protein